MMTDEQKANHDYSLHQDNLFWSRTQFLVAVQGGVLAGTYSLASERWVATGLTVLGAALTILVLLIMNRDWLIGEEAWKASGLPSISPKGWKGRTVSVVAVVILLVADAVLLAWVWWR